MGTALAMGGGPALVAVNCALVLDAWTFSLHFHHSRTGFGWAWPARCPHADSGKSCPGAGEENHWIQEPRERSVLC